MPVPLPIVLVTFPKVVLVRELEGLLELG